MRNQIECLRTLYWQHMFRFFLVRCGFYDINRPFNCRITQNFIKNHKFFHRIHNEAHNGCFRLSIIHLGWIFKSLVAFDLTVHTKRPFEPRFLVKYSENAINYSKNDFIFHMYIAGKIPDIERPSLVRVCEVPLSWKSIY